MLRVLVADGCRDTADRFASLLAPRGHRAEAAYDGPSALAKAWALRPDVVLLDLDIPGMGGAEVARRLRAAGGHQPCLVAMTELHPALLPGEDSAPFDCWVDKPVAPSRLLALLKAVVGSP